MSSPRSQGGSTRGKEMAPEDISLHVNGPGVVDTQKAELINASPSTALMDLLSTYAKELEI